MLQTLGYWREHSSLEERTEFERCLEPVLEKSMGKLKQKRYEDSYHRSLVSKKFFDLACYVNGKPPQHSWQLAAEDYGRDLVIDIADGKGFISIKNLNQKYASAVKVLVQRGMLFEYDGFYCLPSELVMGLRATVNDCTWTTITAKSLLAFLQQLVPKEARLAMQATPLRNELSGWLVVYGQQALNAMAVDEDLNNDDWKLLLALNDQPIKTWDELHVFYPSLKKVEVNHYYQGNVVSLRASLVSEIPEGLRRLICLGLLGIVVKIGDELSASVVLCSEAKVLLKRALKKKKHALVSDIQKQWCVEPCNMEVPSAWFWSHEIWQLWMTLHFLPLGITQQGSLRKSDLKKLAQVLGQSDMGLLEMLIQSMFVGQLVVEKNKVIRAAVIDWRIWLKSYRNQIYNILRQSDTWTEQEKTDCWKLLAELPTDQWLDLDMLETWLKAKSMKGADWHGLLVEFQFSALNHLNMTERKVYFLPQFHDVMVNKTPLWTVPGWHGADSKAKVAGFISASGEVQLPPDCSHKILPKLAIFCSLSSIEHMVTLQLDEKALKRISMDKSALKEVRKVLESLQSQLPQAVAYMFDKQASQKPIGAVAATAMVIQLHDRSAMQRLQRAGFKLSQPFKSHPDIVLLDAHADAHAFMEACVKEGLLLDTLLAPMLWITGTAKIKAWMDCDDNRTDLWLELAYQKTRTSKSKQVYACIRGDYYGWIDIQCASQSKGSYKLLKTTVMLEPKHILRLRELDENEIQKLGLDKLT
ncbi:MAG: hypothetical protein Q9M14_08130 [Mariprofundaceae bacterium]|nr:hypothetical protein [Mariprofundaceae bacterium]